MKKIFLLILVVMLNLNFSEARNIYEKELPDNFKSECFEFNSSYNFSAKNEGKYKIKVNKEDTIAVKGDYLIPIISYKKLGEKYNYTSKIIGKNIFLNDDNLKTFVKIDTDKSKEIILKFNNKILNNTFKLNFKHTATDYIPEIFISEDGKKYSPVSFSNLGDFNLSYFKIIFKPRDEKNIKREIIQIKELSFSKTENINLIKVYGGGKVDFYSNYNCDDYINLDTIGVGFEIDKNTPLAEIKLEKNKKYNPNIVSDTDLDKIQNRDDNCPKVYNPLQKDSNGDGIGDKCSDVDNDGFIGDYDNCPYVKNTDQKDLNNNGIGDACEFDKDKDEIYDSMDNCITVKNPFQKDSDGDGIGDKCDNCKYFNPDQIDKNKNGIGDECDIRKSILEKNDDDNDGIINSKDNCPNISNKEQKDSDKDGIGNKCDNCKFMKNKDQLDFDKNNIGDLCEDSDKDGIEGIEDNCINIYNKDQKDSDNNGIGDVCEDKDGDEIWFAIDNCPYIYNPFQKDLDKDGIGDKCDINDDRLIESNKSFFIFILLIVVIIFGGGIYFMINKLNNTKIEKDKSKKTKAKNKKKVKKEKFLNGKSYTKAKKENIEIDL